MEAELCVSIQYISPDNNLPDHYLKIKISYRAKVRIKATYQKKEHDAHERFQSNSQ